MPANQDETTGFGWGDRIPPAPDRLGSYRIEAALASGGFGVVYRARHAERGTTAAVKILHADHAANGEAVARFEREVAVLQRIRHPGVLEIYEFGRVADGRPYFAMPLLEGVSLKEHLEARGRLPIDDVMAILEPLCAAVSAAHAGGIVHRDIKPSNVFLCTREGAAAGGRAWDRVILLDFGVAKLVDDEGQRLTTSRHVIGTMTCMAPEQILSKPVDARADVYALGTLAYRLLTGDPPFKASSPLAVQQMHLYAAPRPMTTFAPVSPALNAPVLRALSKDRAARQPSAEAFLRELLAAAGKPRAEDARDVLAIHVAVELDPDRAHEAGEEAFADMEAIFPAARAALEPLGFAVVLTTGSSLLLALPRPDAPGRDVAARRGAVDALVKLARALELRPGRSAMVRVRVCLHTTQAGAAPDGRLRGGQLMQLSTWVPELAGDAWLVSTDAAEGLDAPAQNAQEAGGIRWLTLTP